MAYVITCGDEGVQINEGTRLGVVGAGFRLEGFSDIIAIFKQLFGEELYLAASEENDWIKAELDLRTWEQVTASAQQHTEALADRVGVKYAGFLPFTDPKQLAPGVKGHMVRPHGIHIANKISFTVGGGEQTYNLGNYVVSADWVAAAPKELVKSVLETQIAFYEKLSGGSTLLRIVEEAGVLGAETAAANKAVLVELGIV